MDGILVIAQVGFSSSVLKISALRVQGLTSLLESYVYITPTYFREYLLYLWNTFRHPVFVSEFGFPVYGEADKDLPDQLYVSNFSFLHH